MRRYLIFSIIYLTAALCCAGEAVVPAMTAPAEDPVPWTPPAQRPPFRAIKIAAMFDGWSLGGYAKREAIETLADAPEPCSVYAPLPKPTTKAQIQGRNRGLQQFRVRGKPKVQAAVVWFALAHNIVRGRKLTGKAA